MAPRKTYNKERQLNPFFDMADDEFEDLCCNLFKKTNEVIHARKLFGKGYKQFGGDLLVQLEDATSYVVQCKHYPKADFSRSDIEKAVKLFTDHWESHWKNHKVKKFYLVVSRPITTNDQHLAIREQIERLKNEYQVTFYHWEQEDLRTELKPYRDLVVEYLDEYWWNRICPPETNTTAPGLKRGNIAEQLVERNFDQMAVLISENTKKDLEPIRHLARCGKQAEAITKYYKLKQSSFNFINAQTRAELLSLEIRLRFPHEMDLIEARKLIDQIKIEDKNFQTIYLEGLLAGHEKGYTAALEKLTVCPDISTFNLKLSFLINTENYAEVCRLFESEIRNFTIDTETKRLYALALLALGETENAATVIDEAFQEQPDWEGIRLAKGIIQYYGSQTTQVLLENPLAFPQPRQWHLIKTDAGSRRKRQESAEIFKVILSAERKNPEEIQLFESWYLACLADDPEQRAEAISYAQSVLERKPTHAYVLIWALGRNIPVDFARSKISLEEKFKNFNSDDEKSAINEAIILLPLYLRDNQATKAKQHLIKLKPYFEKFNEKDLYAYWDCQIALVKGETAIIEKKLALKVKSKELRQNLQISALLIALQKDPHQKGLRRHYKKRLAKICRKSPDPQYLWLYCQLCHSERNWPELITYGSILLKKIPTGESLRIVCDAYYQSQHPERCLELIENHRHFFPDNELPLDLSRLESHCWLNSGKPFKAQEIARKIYERDKSAINLLTFVETHRHTADWFAISEAVKQMPSLNELSPKEQLQISEMIVSVDPIQATEIWRAVKRRALEMKEIVDSTFFFGNRLGLEDETGDLMKLMMEDTGDGKNHRLLDLTEWRKMKQEEREQLAGVHKLYLEGKIATHLLCLETDETLTSRYHHLPNLNGEAENFREKVKTLIRHGSKIVDSETLLQEKPRWNLHLDISTLLLAHHLDLLESIEKFAPIYVNREIIPHLQSEIKQLEEQTQPLRVAAAKTVLEYLERGNIEKVQVTRVLTSAEQKTYHALISQIGEWNVRLLLQAEEEKAIIIDYLPLRNIQNGKPIKTPTAFQSLIRGWQSVAHSLLTEGLLTAQLAEKCTSAFEKTDDEDVDLKSLPIGSKLYLTGLTAQTLAKLGIFKEVLQNFEVFLEERNELLLRSEEKRFARNQELIGWLKDLQTRLKTGLAKDVYQGISEERLKNENDIQRIRLENYRLRPLLELLSLDGTREHAVVADDRWFSRYATLNHLTPIITIYELLLTLKAHDYISNEEFYKKMHRLRSENFRYLPITKKDFLHHLELAGETRKSPELSTLRKYLADCLLDEKWLEKPLQPAGPGTYAEIEFVFALQRTTVETIGSVWSQSESIEEAHQRADSLLFDFYVGWFGLRHFYPDHLLHQTGAWHLASDFTYFCVQAMGILANTNLSVAERNKRTEAYFNWVEYIFKQHFSDPDFLARCLYYLVVFLGHSTEEVQINLEEPERETDSRQNISIIEMLLLNHLPNVIRKELLENEIIRQKFKFTPESIYSVGDLQFRGEELWIGVDQALRGKKSQVRWKNNNEEILEIKKSGTENEVKVDICRADGSTIHLKDGVIGYLLPEHEQRLEFALSTRNSFDCSGDEFLAKIEEILAINEPEERVGAYSDWAKTSAQIAYENLIREVEMKKGFTGQQLVDFPINRLPQYFYFSRELRDQEPFDIKFKAACESLRKERELEITLDRFARFPKEIPERLVEEFSDLTLEDRKLLVEKFRQNWRSPVGKLHYLALVLRTLSEDEKSLQLAREEAKILFKNEEVNLDFEIFKSLIMLVTDHFHREPETKFWELPVRLSLIWAHAAKLFDIISPLADNNAEKEKLLKYFNSAQPVWNREIFFFEPDFWHDCLHPHFIERQSFFGMSAGKIFTGLPVELLEKVELLPLLKSLCFWESNGQTVSHFLLWKDFANRSDVVDSFLGERGYALFNLLFASEKDLMIFPSENIRECLELSIEQVREDHIDLDAWGKLIFMTDGVPLNKSLQADLIQVIRDLKYEEIWKKDNEIGLNILWLIVNQKSILPEEIFSRVEGWLKWTVTQLAEKYSGKIYANSANKPEQEQAALFIAEIAARMKAVPFDPLSSSYNWNELIFELGHLWSKLPVLLEPTLLHLWLGLPVEQLQGIGKNLLLAKVFRQ